LISWTNINASFIAFLWPFFGVLKTLLVILCVYFIYAFINKGKDVGWKIKTIFILLLAPVLIFASTNLSLTGFDLVNCDAFLYEGLYFKYYYTAVSYIAIIWIFALLIKSYRTADQGFKKQILLMGTGMELFLLLFVTIVFIVTYLTNVSLLSDSRLEMYGLFGQLVFMVTISVLIVRFKAFNVGLIASQALLVGLVVLIASQFTFVESVFGIILTSITLVITGIVGILLLRSVKKEIKQREELQVVTQKLAMANEKLKVLDKLKSEFVSIASHQLRSPLTAIRGYASLIMDGSFGKIPKKAEEPLERISESAKNMAFSIEDYLNVSRIESGNMKYNLTELNLKEETEKICDDLRPEAVKKGLTLLFRSDMKSKGIIKTDLGKVIQIVQNLINNSIKYTPKGSIKVLVRDDIKRKRIYVDIIDTGIGMNSKTLDTIFGKFERAENANVANIHGTGLGLFVAHKMAVAMGGDIKAQSEGDDKGSIFTIEFPLSM